MIDVRIPKIDLTVQLSRSTVNQDTDLSSSMLLIAINSNLLDSLVEFTELLLGPVLWHKLEH
jgi:hypothetical protein